MIAGAGCGAKNFRPYSQISLENRAFPRAAACPPVAYLCNTTTRRRGAGSAAGAGGGNGPIFGPVARAQAPHRRKIMCATRFSATACIRPRNLEKSFKKPLTLSDRNDTLLLVLRLKGCERLTSPSMQRPERSGRRVEGTAKREFAAEGWQRSQDCDTVDLHVERGGRHSPPELGKAADIFLRWFFEI